MSTDPSEKAALYAIYGEAYDPSSDDADRVMAKVRASLLTQAPQAVPARGSSLSGGRLLKYAGLSAIAIVIAGAAGSLLLREDSVRRMSQPASSFSSSSSFRGSPSQSAVTRPAENAPAVPSISVDALPSATAPRVNIKTAPAASSAEGFASASAALPPSNETLAREARLVADARRALQAGDPERALSLLDEHAREFPKGWLASDRAAERIEVLCKLGRRAEAIRDARAFLEAHPRSPLGHRVATSCGGSEGE